MSSVEAVALAPHLSRHSLEFLRPSCHLRFWACDPADSEMPARFGGFQGFLRGSARVAYHPLLGRIWAFENKGPLETFAHESSNFQYAFFAFLPVIPYQVNACPPSSFF